MCSADLQIKVIDFCKQFFMSALSNSGRAEATAQQLQGEVFKKALLTRVREKRFTERVRGKFKEGLGNVQSFRVEWCEEKDGI